MKRIFLAALGITMACSIQAQWQNQRTGSVYITVTGNKNLQVMVDGTPYSLSTNGTTSKLNTPVTGLAAGMHSLAFTRTNNNRRGDMTTQFNLRKNYDMYINVTSNGALELIEKRKGAAVTGNTSMSAANFNIVMRDLRLQGPTQKPTFLTTTFNRSNTYFTTTQVVQLLQQVRLESDRLPLAKLSFRTVTDPNNFATVYGLFTSQANRSDLEDYVNYYDEEAIIVDTDPGTGMSETNFNDLYRRIKNEYSINAQVNAISTAFGTTGNRFTASQASQLIQLINSEASRLSLAKLSYRTVVDPSNFSTVTNLLYTQSSRDELLAYINNGGVNSDIVLHTAMTETDFNNLYQSAKGQFLPLAKMNYLTNTFNNPTYYFTVSQAKTLIQLLSSESNRLQLSKAVYRNLVDRPNYTQLYDLLPSSSSRTELDNYVKAYRE